MLVSRLKATRKEQIMSDQTCTQAKMLAAFPLTTARDRRWWRHWRSLGVTRHINKFLCKTTQKRDSVLAIHTSGLN